MGAGRKAAARHRPCPHHLRPAVILGSPAGQLAAGAPRRCHPHLRSRGAVAGRRRHPRQPGQEHPVPGLRHAGDSHDDDRWRTGRVRRLIQHHCATKNGQPWACPFIWGNAVAGNSIVIHHDCYLARTRRSDPPTVVASFVSEPVEQNLGSHRGTTTWKISWVGMHCSNSRHQRSGGFGP